MTTGTTMGTHRFVRLLASVTSEGEARLAFQGGADIIDCKNPSAGALGALPHADVARIRAAVPRHVPISATIGDLAAEPEPVLEAARAMAATGCDIVKVGLFPDGDAHATIRHLGHHIAGQTALVAVLMADAALDLSLVSALGEAGFSGVMLDTAHKDGRTLLDHCDRATLSAFITEAHNVSLYAGLAGSLRLAQISELLALAPDVLGFRGALCRGASRTDTLEASALAAVRRAIPRAGEADEHRTPTQLELEATS
ncbi:(5-formylfuran-3-yl)methyl phosphate synthase [Hyphomicrobium sp. CS1GBMeth3]|uniref:(5-formylfuran-3-yl)methyl phosphate synthase n=1 Tax=Hyphomicrobium sp. CS1GBMeth3 TaxID=1892845 RepID=UPI0009FABB84|nr:(5-formylfuran-3-yl)methyl phosphate synthase [Hyphomicrobium sp. CS1GBMeth3]